MAVLTGYLLGKRTPLQLIRVSRSGVGRQSNNIQLHFLNCRSETSSAFISTAPRLDEFPHLSAPDAFHICRGPLAGRGVVLPRGLARLGAHVAAFRGATESLTAALAAAEISLLLPCDAALHSTTQLVLYDVAEAAAAVAADPTAAAVTKRAGQECATCMQR